MDESDRLGALEARVDKIEDRLAVQSDQLTELLRIVREHFVKCPGHQDGDPLP